MFQAGLRKSSKLGKCRELYGNYKIRIFDKVNNKCMFILYYNFRALDVHSLIGYIGGYVGLLLGISVLQIPGILLTVLGKINKFWQDKMKEQLVSMKN